jgi:hypothetical protein
MMMDDRRFDLPEWMIDRIREEYVAELNAIKEDELCISPGWAGSDLNITIYGESAGDFKAQRFSIEDLCLELLAGWHNVHGETSQYNYDTIGEIAAKMEQQAAKMRELLGTLKIRG